MFVETLRRPCNTWSVKAIEAAVRTVVDLLARSEYEAVERLTSGDQMTASEIDEAISVYGRTLVRPESGWWQLVEVTPVTVEPAKVHVAG